MNIANQSLLRQASTWLSVISVILAMVMGALTAIALVGHAAPGVLALAACFLPLLAGGIEDTYPAYVSALAGWGFVGAASLVLGLPLGLAAALSGAAAGGILETRLQARFSL